MAQKPAVFDGDFVRILKNGLKLTNGIKITGDAIDPTETAVDGELGDIFISSISPGGMYQKTDSGVTTNWNLIAASVSGVNTVAGRAGDVVLSKSDISGIDQVDNTSDLNKPVSTATQTALDGKQPLDADLTTIAGLTATTDNFMQAKAGAWASRTVVQVKSDLSINNVDNTSDANKPVSTAQAAADAVVQATVYQSTINAQTGTTYTLVLSDLGKLVTLSNAGAITLTVPLNSSVAYQIGARIDLAQLGAGQVTVAATGGVTLNGTPGLKFRAQYSAASLIKLGTDTWILVGDLAA